MRLLSNMLRISSNTFRLCVIGHSLIPSDIQITDLPNVNVSVLRYPGATVDSLIRELDSICFWIRRHDGIILCMGVTT